MSRVICKTHGQPYAGNMSKDGARENALVLHSRSKPGAHEYSLLEDVTTCSELLMCAC